MQSYCSVYCCFSCLAWWKCCNFAGQPAGHGPTIFTGQPAGLTEGLPVGSGHKNLLSSLILPIQCFIESASSLHPICSNHLSISLHSGQKSTLYLKLDGNCCSLLLSLSRSCSYRVYWTDSLYLFLCFFLFYVAWICKLPCGHTVLKIIQTSLVCEFLWLFLWAIL